VEYQNLWQRSVIGFTAVSADKAKLELFVTSIEDTLYKYPSDIEIMGIEYDIISQKI